MIDDVNDTITAALADRIAGPLPQREGTFTGAMMGEYRITATSAERDLIVAALRAYANRASTMPHKLPTLPDNDSDFTPDLARKIIAQYQQFVELLSCSSDRASTSDRWLVRKCNR